MWAGKVKPILMDTNLYSFWVQQRRAHMRMGGVLANSQERTALAGTPQGLGSIVDLYAAHRER